MIGKVRLRQASLKVIQHPTQPRSGRVPSETLRGVHPIPDKVRRGHGGGTAASLRAHALRAVRQFAWLEVGSVKLALSCPAHQYPEGA